MASMSLYRRYRPRRFSELRGQDHVVRALRSAVAANREGHAYLFSGPRGTGKTSSARILAKALNCEQPDDGEPCCACASCLAVEAGTSYDVFELDAASNNGVDAMRDLIERAMLGTPGRHKVYILDEVHMLSKAAEAALLKTLEEPPEHVVFVLATTDPQKVSDTIRSRTQHLQFHLLPMAELEQHVRWVAQDAGIEVSDRAVQAVLQQGGGSARDTLSALELVAASGELAVETTPLDEFVEAIIEADPGRALAAVAAGVQQGRDVRAITEAVLTQLRDCFLSLMAPELVQLPDRRAAEVADQAQRLGPAAVVRAMEALGDILVEMRQAPDPRILLDIAMVKLTNTRADHGTGALAARLERLEQAVAALEAAPPTAPPRPAPVDPGTGRALLGGAVRRSGEPTAPTPRPQLRVVDRTDAPAADGRGSAAPPDPAPAPNRGAAPGASPTAPDTATLPTRAEIESAWAEHVLAQVKPMARALYMAGRILGPRGGSVAIALPNDAHRNRAEEQRSQVEQALAGHFGRPVPVVLVLDDGSDTTAPTDRPGDRVTARGPERAPEGPSAGRADRADRDVVSPAPRPETTAKLRRSAAPAGPGTAGGAGTGAADATGALATGPSAASPPLRPGTAAGRPPVADLADEEAIDPDELVDVPPEGHLTGVDRVAAAFPGSEWIEED
jgi:DNA polymerase-3 subunit gamma/tau